MKNWEGLKGYVTAFRDGKFRFMFMLFVDGDCVSHFDSNKRYDNYEAAEKDLNTSMTHMRKKLEQEVAAANLANINLSDELVH